MATDREEEEELQMALRMSLQSSPPGAKRSKPRDLTAPSSSAGVESDEARNRRLQRELMAAAAEKRIRALTKGKGTEEEVAVVEQERESEISDETMREVEVEEEKGEMKVIELVAEMPLPELGEEMPLLSVEELFVMIFGEGVSRAVLAQWCNQGIRFSSDPETSMGLVQHEGGPCGVLATLQAYVLKYLLFFTDDLSNPEISSENRIFYQSSSITNDNFALISEERKTRALVHAMVEILFLCGSGKKAVIACLGGFAQIVQEGTETDQKEAISRVLDGISIESAFDLHKYLRVSTYSSRKDSFETLMTILPLFQSRLGALLFLISTLLSRGLDLIQEDRDDPTLPLVTAPFGHASQEIVNLLLCGEAAPNVFDGKMDLGGGMSLKGIPSNVQVGFLTLLESLNLCKVGQFLKCPWFPIWVVGSESHYTVLFALDPKVQDENELEKRESEIRQVFDSKDQSGGGGFITEEAFRTVLRDTNVFFPEEKIESLCGAGFIVWSEFWQALLDLDKNLGGMKDSNGNGLVGSKQFDIYHFNGIAKSVMNGGEGGPPVQRPRLCKLNVAVPPRWTQEGYLADVANNKEEDVVIALSEPPPKVSNQHAPLVDCVRTRWGRAVCSWSGDAPSIV
ncbi:hypothetical protein LUZ60_004179 [Juncus effusus]|nr:hypothetical protein LUZ60_004179 [Juncus effusus]